MANFTAANVKELRERTGCGMMDCKKALTESNGDMDKAIEFLREKGLAAAAKKAGRIAAEGLVESFISEDGKIGALLEVNSETDFVAKNADFQQFVSNVVRIVAEKNPADMDALMNETYEADLTVADALREKILTIGENLNIRRFARYEGPVSAYIHGGGRIGVLVQFAADDAVAAKLEFAELAKDVAMQVAAAMPAYLDRNSVPADVLEKEKEILTVQARNEGKPENIIEKMVNGRINKYYTENCLVDQVFVKDSDLTITKLLAAKGKELGGTIEIKGFTRFEKGEGLEKKEEDFAAEIAKMTQK